MTPAEAQVYCETVTRQSGSNFAASFFFLPRKRRAAMYTIYAFCREVDSAVDDPAPGTDPRDALKRWRAELAAAYRGQATAPVTVSLAEHVRELGIPREYFEELLAGVEMDLVQRRYATFEELYRYCYRVASVVGLICLKIFETHAPESRDYAVNLGLAFQLTNILRDIGSDADRDRIYLPQEDLARFGYSPDDLLAKRYSPQFAALMRFEADRARDYYAKVSAIAETLPPADRRALIVAEMMRGVYTRILSRIEEGGFRVFGPRVRISAAHRLAIASGVYFRSLIR
jgi:phytoene synthase